jgi:phosphotransacetylase
MPVIKNMTFDEVKPGDTASTQRTLQARDVCAWASAFGNVGMLVEAGETQDTAGIITAIFTALVGSSLPGPGSSIRSTAVRVLTALPVNVALTAEVTVREKKTDDMLVMLDGKCTDQAGQVVATIALEVVAPQKQQQREVPEHRLEELVKSCRGLKQMLTGIVHPCSVEALAGAVEAAKAGLIMPVLFGPDVEMRKIAEAAKLNISGFHIVATKNSVDSAQKAALAAGAGEVQVLMKGSLHTDILLHAIMQKESNLHTGHLLSHCALMSVPTYARRIILTDVALNIAPDTDQKRGICQNAIGFAIALGIKTPKVAVLAAVETVSTKMPATLDGAILAKMADRRQIVGGIVDGPLDLDAAVDVGAARVKHISSPVAGEADVLVAPNIEAGNMVYKNLSFMADAQTAGLVIGARVPVILTSRADTADARRFSAATAVLYADALAHDHASILPEIEE